ncbi:MAG: glutamine synthetase [Sulfurovum sp.]|nr:glutamine synthetase [Sulfurovum sp.]
MEHLKEKGIKFVRVLWCDNANIIRAKSVHIKYLEDTLDSGVKIAKAQMGIPVMYDAVAPNAGLSPVGEVTLVPDPTTLKILPFAKGQASMIGDMKSLGDLTPWFNCPRDYLKRQIDRLSGMGLEIKSVFENEFYLLKKDEDGNIIKSDETSFAMTAPQNSYDQMILDLEESMTSQGLEVESYYSESGPGQHEFNVKYSDALQSADNQITYRETVRAVASRYGLIASFMPKIFEDAGGNGTHLNFSLWRDEENISGESNEKNGISKTSSAFVAGIMHHLKALCAVTIPSTNSYRRVIPHFWAGAFVSWGYYNREAAIRVSKNESQSKAQRFELKISDASANPYLALGALIACGIDGIEKDMVLPEETTIDPGYLKSSECESRWVERLPKNLGEALDYLKDDSIVLNSMGEELAKSYVGVKEFEWDVLKSATLEEEVKIMLERF